MVYRLMAWAGSAVEGHIRFGVEVASGTDVTLTSGFVMTMAICSGGCVRDVTV